MEEYIYDFDIFCTRCGLKSEKSPSLANHMVYLKSINNFLTFWSYEEQERNVKKKLILDFEVWTCRHCTHSYTHNKYYLVLNTSIFFHFGPTVRCDNLSAEAIVFKFRNIMRTEDTLFHKLSVVCRAANQGKKYRGKCHKYYGRYLLNWCFAFKT